MSEIESSMDSLISLLVEACSKNEQLEGVDSEVIRRIVSSIEGQVFSKDDRKESIKLLDKIIDEIVNEIYQAGK